MKTNSKRSPSARRFTPSYTARSIGVNLLVEGSVRQKTNARRLSRRVQYTAWVEGQGCFFRTADRARTSARRSKRRPSCRPGPQRAQCGHPAEATRPTRTPPSTPPRSALPRRRGCRGPRGTTLRSTPTGSPSPGASKSPPWVAAGRFSAKARRLQQKLHCPLLFLPPLLPRIHSSSQYSRECRSKIWREPTTVERNEHAVSKNVLVSILKHATTVVTKPKAS
jgi:hypothetical protein